MKLGYYKEGNMLTDNLYKRICDCEMNATNEQTYYEFIRESEEIFMFITDDIKNMS